MLRKCLAFLSLVLATSAAAADDKAAEPEQPEVQTLSIGPVAFGDYPAVLVSLKECKLYKADKNGDPSPDLESSIDLFIEPRDPEIASYLGKGKRAQLAFLDVDFDKVERLPEGIDWSSRLPRKQSILKSGFVFFVRSVLGNTYKVRVDELDSKAQTMKLSYARLNPRLIEPSTDKTPLSPAAQAVALRAVSDFFLEFDPDRAAKHLAPNGTYRNDRPGSIKQLIDEMKELHQADKPFPAIREVGFFTNQDMPKTQERLGVYKGATSMFQKTRIPAHLNNGLGCYVVTYPLEIGERGMTAVIVMIFQKIGDEYKIVYIDDN